MDYTVLPTITVDCPDELVLKSGFIEELLERLEKLNNKYYDARMPYPCNELEVVVNIKGKVAISKNYGKK